MRRAFESWLPWVLVVLVACVWLNQTVGYNTWGERPEPTFDARRAPLQTARAPFIHLYERSGDERYYFEIANALLGAPYDKHVFSDTRGDVPYAADQEPPPPDGKWHAPYSAVPFEYPPLALPFILGPRLLAPTFPRFCFVFGALMGLCLVAAIAAAIDTLRIAGASDKDLRLRAWLSVALLLAQGALAIQRLDAVTALFLALALRAAVRRRPFELGLTLGLAAASKLVPVLLLPVVLASDWSTWRARAVLARVGAGLAVALAIGFGPALLLSPHGLLDVVRYHRERGLQVESTFALLREIPGALFGHPATVSHSYGSFNVEGPAARFLARLSLPALAIATAFLTLRAFRGARFEETRTTRVPLAAVAGVVALWLVGKVFSPQYLTWAIPLVLAVPGALGVRITFTALGAMALTQLYHRGFYPLVVEQHAAALLALAARQCALGYLGYLAVKGLAISSESEPVFGAERGGRLLAMFACAFLWSYGLMIFEVARRERLRLSPEAIVVTAYRDHDFGGAHRSFGEGTYGPHELGEVGNDAISSLRVGSHVRVRVCEHENGGTCAEFGPGSNVAFVGPLLNDRISYLEVRPR